MSPNINNEESQKIKFAIPTIIVVSSSKDRSPLAKLQEREMPYPITREHRQELQEKAVKEHISFDDALFFEMREKILNMPSVQSSFSTIRNQYEFPVVIEIQRNGRVKKVESFKTLSQVQKERKIRIFYPHPYRRAFYVLLLILFLLIVASIYYGAFHR